MYFFRLLSAFIFACVAIFFVYLGVWHFSIKQMEEVLPAKLNSVFGVEVAFSKVKQRMNPLRMEMVVEDLSVAYDAKGTGRYQHYLGDVVLSADFWSFDKFQIDLPNYQKVQVTKADKVVDYNLTQKNARVDVFLNGMELQDFYYSANDYALQAAGQTAPIVAGDYVYYSCFGRYSGECGLTLSNVSFLQQKYESVSATWKMLTASSVDLASSAVNVLSSSPAVGYRSEALKALNNQELSVQVLSSHVEKDGFWISSSGDVNLSKGGVLVGNLSFTSNDQRMILDYLMQRGLLSGMSRDKLALIRSLIGGSRKSYTVGYAVENGKLLVNGDVAGDVSRLRSFFVPAGR